MTQLLESLERRDQKRLRRELACVLLVDGCRHRGLVRDISAWGLFVETPGELPQGSDVVVAFRTPERERFVLEASVPHRRQASRSLTSHSADGVGLCIQDPPAAYRRWVEGSSADE
jgi:hypothetical protein